MRMSSGRHAGTSDVPTMTVGAAHHQHQAILQPCMGSPVGRHRFPSSQQLLPKLSHKHAKMLQVV